MQITVTVNGAARRLEGAVTVEAYLIQAGVAAEYVAAALNGEALTPSKRRATVLRDGDRLEIVRPAGGG